jgi:hypothetical protein
MLSKHGERWDDFMECLARLRLWRALLQSPSATRMNRFELEMRFKMAESDLSRFPLGWREEAGEEGSRG